MFLLGALLVHPGAAAQRRESADQETLEQRKLDLERTRVEGDLRLRQAEIELKRDELELRKAEQGGVGSFKVNATAATMAVALIGLLGTAIAALIQARSNYRTQTDLEKRKFESDLILKSIETGDVAASTRNVLFLLKAGFIADPEGTIARLAQDADAVPVLPPRAYSSGAFEGIPPEGVGGDPDLNVLKNRDLPPRQYTPRALQEIIAQPAPTTSGPRRTWPEDARSRIAELESQGVVVEGYLRSVKPLGPTAANARRQPKENRDWRLALVAAPDADHASSVVAVVSPRIRANHPEWTLAKLQELSASRQRVRIGGWLLFGSPTLMKVRQAATSWRIHPVLKIEVGSRRGWTDLV